MSSLPFVLLLTSCAYSYNLSEMASWGPALAASQLGTTIRESVPQPVSRVDSRSPRMAFETPEHWNFNSKPMEYYQPPADSSDERRIYVQPERKYGESYKITIPEETEYSHCQEHKSTEDGLTQIANVVSKVAKMLFGASVILLLPLIMAKLFFFPLKLFLAMKILLKLMLLWPFLMRSFPGMMPTPSVEAKLVVPSVIDTARELVDFLEVQYYSDSNDTRSPKVLNNFGGTMNSTSDYLNSSSEFAPYCDVKMSCFMSKSMSSKHYITKLVTSAAILFGKESIRHPRFMKFLENKSEFKECAQMLAQPDRKDIAKDTLTIPLVSNDVESTSLKLQQLQAKLGQLEGLVRSLSSDGSSAKSERAETSSPPPLAPSTKEPPTTARPKNAPPNPPQDFTNLFSDLGGGNGIAVDESQINALRSEIEALEKQLGRRHDGNSHNTFDNPPVTEPPTMFHFHQQQNVPHQSLFDRDSQVAANPNFNREAPQFRSNEPANREAEFNILHQLWNQPGGAPAASDTQSVTRADGEQPLSPRLHNKPFLSANNYNYPLYGSGYGIAPQKRPELFGSKFPYGGDSRPQSSDVTYNVDTKPELRPLKYGGNSQDFNYNGYQNYGAGNSHQGNTQDYFEMGNTLQGNVQNGNKVGLGTQNSLNNVSGGKGGVILQFVLEVMRMIASGNGVGLIGVLLRLPVVILTNFVQSVGSSIATNGLRGIISRGIIPLVVLVGANLLIIFLTWFMWDDGSTASLIAAQGLLAAQGLAAPPQNM